MLADKVLAAVGQDFDRATLGAIRGFAASLCGAHKFVLNDDVAVACHLVSNTKPSTMVTALPFCRTPFENTWVEWPFAAVQQAGGYGEPRQVDYITPIRVGVLLEMDETFQRGILSLAWDNKAEPGVTLSMLAAEVDWTGNPERPVKAWDAEAFYEKNLPNLSENAQKWWRDKREKAWMIEQLSHSEATITPYYEKFCEAAIANGRRDYLKDQLDKGVLDWAGEQKFIEAALILLNSRNCVFFEDADLSRLNRARAKRGKPSLQQHSVVKIKLSQALARAQERGAGKANVMRHLVRGHFKVRKTGVFWWSPYVRGNLGDAKARRYEVAA